MPQRRRRAVDSIDCRSDVVLRQTGEPAPWDGIIPPDDLEVMEVESRADQGMGVNPAVLVVDMTHAFVDDAYPLGDGANGIPCAQAIAHLLTVARSAGIPVIYSAGLDSVNPAEAGRWKSPSSRAAESRLPTPNAIVPMLAPHRGESVVHKRRPSAFFGTELISLLIYHQVDTLIVAGMSTSGCVRATVIDAFSHNLRVVVPHECVADRARMSHAVALFDIHAKYGDVVATADLEAALRDRHPLEAVAGR
jgi:maleamate amidohydrolase